MLFIQLDQGAVLLKEIPHPQNRPFISSFGVQGPLPGASKAGQEGATPDVLVNPGAGPRDDILNRRQVLP